MSFISGSRGVRQREGALDATASCLSGVKVGRRKTTTAGRFLLVLAVLVATLGFCTVSAVAQTGWFDPAWSYRSQVTVTNLDATMPANLQVKVALDGSFDFSRAQSNGADLRVTDADGRTALPFWIEKWNPSATGATVWVNVPSIPASGETLYFYYGNPSATSASNGNATFDFFDDFDTGGSQQLGFFQLSQPINPMPLLQDQSWESDPPHTLSVVEANSGGFQYWGFYGLAGGCGGVGLAMSNDLNNWTKYQGNPLFEDGRWPSVLYINGTYYMAYEKDYCANSYIELATSADGVNFTDLKMLVPPETGLRNQNPHLWLNPNDGQFYLYYYRGNDLNDFDIRVRKASTITALDASPYSLLVHSTISLAAPNMLYDGGTYYLATESRNPHTSLWETSVYTSVSPDSGFSPLPGNPVLSPGACFFQHTFGTTMHAYYCDFDHTNNIWTLKHRTADLTAPRQVFYALDTSKWAIGGGGAWVLASDTQQDGSTGFVAQGSTFGKQILYSRTFNGSDYVLDAYGKQVGGRVWGVGVRVTDQDNLYSANLYDDLNFNNNLYLYSWLTNAQTGTLGSAATGQVDPNAWYKLTVKAHGTSIDVYRDDVLQIQSSDSRFSSGTIALYGEAQTVARFNNVLVRKYVSTEPTVTVSPSSQQATFVLTVNPTTVQGGNSSQGTVSLASPAPVGGAVVSLGSGDPSVTVPSSVSVPGGATIATFPITTTAVASQLTAVISGTYNGTSLNVNLTVTPAPLVLTSLTVNPASLIGGTSTTATVTLSGVAPAGGITVILSSNNGAAQVPGSLTVAPGSATATFPVTTSLVSSVANVTLSGSYNGATQTAGLTVNPAALTSMVLNPNSGVGGFSSTGTITLNGPAPVGGFVVTLSSNNAAAQVPPTVTVAANSASVTFTVTTSAVGATTSPIITATFNGSVQTAGLTLNAPGVAALGLNPSSVLGGSSSTGTVTLTSAAPAGGAVVTLSSNSTAAHVPASVTVAANASSATFTVTTSAVSSSTPATITATYSGTTQTAGLTINAATLTSITATPTSVVGGVSSTGTVTLNGPAPVGGALVTLSSSDTSAATVPASVTVAANASTATFTISSIPVATNAAVTISAVYGGVTRTASLTVNAATLNSVSLSPISVLGGSNSTGTVTLSGRAPAGGAVVTLTSSNSSAATLPSSVTVAANATTAIFTITSKAVGSNTSVTISGSYRGTTRTANLTVNAATLISVSLNPTTVRWGNQSTGTVTLNGPAPSGGAVITLSSGNILVATLPGSVTVPANATTATFTVNTLTVTRNTSVTISSSYRGTTRRATLTVTP
jgi:hypothetical protein